MSITVIAINETVELSLDIEARITGINIHGQERIQYQVVWWEGSKRQIAWVDEAEVKHTVAQDTETIVFRTKAKEK